MEKSKVVKYSNLMSEADLKVSMICDLDTNLIGHSVANLQDQQLYITGGSIGNDSARKTAIQVNLKMKSISCLPDMNQGRCFHSSVIHSKKLYLFAGSARFDSEAICNVEVLDLLQPSAWSILFDGDPRIRLGESPLATSFSPSEILLAGGCVDGLKHCKIVTFNVKSNTLTEHIDPSARVFQCPQKPALLSEGKIMSLIVDNNSTLHLAKFVRKDGAIRMKIKDSLGHSKN